MTKSKSSSKKIIEIVLIAFIILSVGLIVTEMASNLSSEIANRDREGSSIQEILPTPYPTLTADELRESLSQPINEAGNN